MTAGKELREWEELLGRYGVAPETDAARRLAAFRDLLRKWNARMSLTGSTEWSALVPHFEEALWAARSVGGVRGRHFDIGSGGGFPAIPMKILYPGDEWILVESRERKAIFLETVLRELGLGSAIVECARLERVLAGWPKAAELGAVSWKGIRLARADWSRLLQLSTGRTRLLLFHGDSLPVEEPEAFAVATTTLRRLAVPGRERSWLTIATPARA